jgi:hypothetical protein
VVVAHGRQLLVAYRFEVKKHTLNDAGTIWFGETVIFPDRHVGFGFRKMTLNIIWECFDASYGRTGKYCLGLTLMTGNIIWECFDAFLEEPGNIVWASL